MVIREGTSIWIVAEWKDPIPGSRIQGVILENDVEVTKSIHNNILCLAPKTGLYTFVLSYANAKALFDSYGESLREHYTEIRERLGPSYATAIGIDKIVKTDIKNRNARYKRFLVSKKREYLIHMLKEACGIDLSEIVGSVADEWVDEHLKDMFNLIHLPWPDFSDEDLEKACLKTMRIR